MARVEIDSPAPEFELQALDGRTVRLSDYAGEKHVLVVFNRGLT